MIRATALILLVALAGPAAAASAPPIEKVRQSARAVLEDERFQRDLPTDKEPFDSPEDDYGAEPFSLGDLGPIGSFVLWTLVVAGGGLLVFYLISRISGRFVRRAPAAETQDETRWRVDGAAPATDTGSLAMADQLARQRDFTGAIRLLLTRSFDELRRFIDGSVAASLTSREIVSQAPLDDTRRIALGDIVSAAEMCHFAGRPPSEDDYLACRESFIRFAPPAPEHEVPA